MAKQDNSTAIVFGKMKEDINDIKGDVSKLKVRVGAIEEQPSGGKSSSPIIMNELLYNATRSAFLDVLKERDKKREESDISFEQVMTDFQEQWIKRADAIVNAYNKFKKQSINVEDRLSSLETLIKTCKKTCNEVNPIVEITPFQHVQLAFKNLYQKSFLLDPRVIILISFLVMFICISADLGKKIVNLQETQEKYELLRNVYKKNADISADIKYIDNLFLDKDKNEEEIEKIKR